MEQGTPAAGDTEPRAQAAGDTSMRGYRQEGTNAGPRDKSRGQRRLIGDLLTDCLID